MIHGAMEILRAVPAAEIDPLLLARSYRSVTPAYVAVTCQDEPGVVDLLFLDGGGTLFCARFDSGMRVFQTPEDFSRRLSGQEARMTVSLFQIAAPLMERFRWTLRAQPCLKLPVGPCTCRQLALLVAAGAPERAILEINRPGLPLPGLELYAFDSREQLLASLALARDGVMLLYDVAGNERFLFSGTARESGPGKEPNDQESAGPSAPGVSGLRLAPSSGPEQAGDPQADAITGGEAGSEGPDAPGPAGGTGRGPEGAAMPLPGERPPSAPVAADRVSASTSERVRVADVPEGIPGSREQRPASAVPGGEAVRPGCRPLPLEGACDPGLFDDPGPQEQAENGGKEAASGEDIVMLMQRAISTFRKEADEVFGRKMDRVYSGIVEELRKQDPAFDPARLTAGTASLVIELLARLQRKAPLLKRSRLRPALLLLLENLYNRHYDLLEAHGASEKVEQAYYRVKGA